MPESFVGIAPKSEDYRAKEFNFKLTKVDIKIMCALRQDGRKSVNDIAEEIRVSPKTVRNHLKTLLDEDVMGLQLIANQAESGNFVPFLQIYLDPSKDKNDIILHLRRHMFPPLVETNNYTNHLNMITAYGWIQNMAQLSEVVSEIGKVEGVRSVVPNVFVKSCSQCTWLDKLLDDPEQCIKYLQDKKII